MVTSHDSLGLSWNLIRTLVMMMNSFIQAVSSIFFLPFSRSCFWDFPGFFPENSQGVSSGILQELLKDFH